MISIFDDVCDYPQTIEKYRKCGVKVEYVEMCILLAKLYKNNANVYSVKHKNSSNKYDGIYLECFEINVLFQPIADENGVSSLIFVEYPDLQNYTKKYIGICTKDICRNISKFYNMCKNTIFIDVVRQEFVEYCLQKSDWWSKFTWLIPVIAIGAIGVICIRR
jgi:hypothetical protein